MTQVSSSFTLNQRPGRNQCYEEAVASGVPLRMMLIPAGRFLMGSPAGELERRDSEGPQHEVTLSQFFMAKYPVTQAQWRAVARLPQVNQSLELHPSRFKGDLRPVEQVSWDDAVEFCDRLTNLTDRQYRLPSEAEWEYACRAGTTTPFHFGEILTTDIANYHGQDQAISKIEFSGSYSGGRKGEHRKETTPVNHFEGANAFGLCDMHGNVWEWCQDNWHKNYNGAPNDGSAWVEDGDSKYRFRRGGSWADYPRYCRSAYRSPDTCDNRNNVIGFRVVCSGAVNKNLIQNRSSGLTEGLRTLLKLACEDGFQDRTIAQRLQITESEIRDYWRQAYELLGIDIDAEKAVGRNLRVTTCLRARQSGWFD